MINKPSLFKDLNIGIPIIIPKEGRGFTNHGSFYMNARTWNFWV